MAEKRFYWIKLKTDFFNQDTIDFILQQENGCKYIVLYQMLCLKTANNNGELNTKIGEMIVPYDIEKIQRDTKYFDIDTIIVALELFKKLGLIYEEKDKTLKISSFDEMVGSESKSAQIKRNQRKNNIPLKNCKRLNSEMLKLPNGNVVFVDEKRYGGNGMLAYDLAGGKCEMCGSEENLCIHHNNGFSNNIEDLFILCRKCHSNIEHKEGVEIVHRYVHQEIEYRDKSIDIDNKKENNKKKKYFDNEELNNLFLDFLDLRKKIKAVNSERAINNLLNKLNKYDDDTKIKMIDKSITNSWKDVYELKEEKTNCNTLKKVGEGAFQL